MANLRGGTITLGTAFVRLEATSRPARWLTIRNAPSNATIQFSFDGISPAGFLLGGEAKTFMNASPYDVYVNGTAAQALYWDVQE